MGLFFFFFLGNMGPPLFSPHSFPTGPDNHMQAEGGTASGRAGSLVSSPRLLLAGSLVGFAQGQSC